MVEGVGKGFLQVFAHAIDAPLQLADGLPIVKIGKSPLVLAQWVCGGDLNGGLVPVDHFKHYRAVYGIALRHDAVRTFVKAGVMVEAQGFTVYMKLAIFTGDAPLGQVPGGDIQARGAQNRHLWEQGRGQVHPALVGEDAVGDVVDAQTVAALAPPCGKSTPGIGGGNGHKTQVVHAVFEGADFVVPNSHPVVFGGGLVGGQGNAVVLQGG